MATKTTGGSMYSGLLQTNQELAKAKAEASAGVGKGLAEGFKPLQGYLMGVAAKEQKRLDQLDSDMGTAGGYLGKMTDTAGILGEFEQEITDFGVTTKNLLNDIAKDESLNQFEKQAGYVEAVNAFNKRVSLYSGDQEIIAGLSGRFANGTISKANDLTGDDYLIGRALATGNFTVKNGQYSIFDDNKQQIKVTGAIDSNRIKNLYVTDTKYNFDEISAGYAKIGAAAKTEQELERLIRQAALGFGTKESALAQLVEGDYYEYEAIKDNTLEELQDKIYTAGYNTASQTFHAEKPKIELAGTAKQMGMRIMNTYDSAFNAKNYNAFLGMEFGGDIVSAYEVKADGKIQFKTTDAKGRLIETSLIDPSNANTRSAVLNELINASSGTATQKNDALNFISTYTPSSGAPSSSGSSGISGYDPVFNEEYKPGKGGKYSADVLNLSTDIIPEPKPEIIPGRYSGGGGGTGQGGTLASNSPFTNENSISFKEHEKRKTEFEQTYETYTEQNLAKFRQDKEGRSEQEDRTRALENLAFNTNANNEGNKPAKKVFNSLDEIKTKYSLTEKELKELKGWKNKTINELLAELHRITTDGKGNDRFLEAANAGKLKREELLEKKNFKTD